ncbi:hypothetical protein SLE2022_141020 [Rubroshorea leprosula]
MHANGTKRGFCGKMKEDTNHLMLLCHQSYLVWLKCFGWWNIAYVLRYAYKEDLKQHAWATENQKGWKVVWYAITWSLWLARNEVVFNGKQMRDAVFERPQKPFLFLGSVPSLIVDHTRTLSGVKTQEGARYTKCVNCHEFSS